ncbi:hypothetical protein XNC3_110014 [Xenorhabdus nematophila F1]|nr:hypothetical protein XNC3_110014 [Xenorhabdus nematophila F1]
MAINQIAKIGLSSLQVIYYFEILFILPEYYQSADIWAVYVTRLAMSARIRVTIEFLERYFQLHYSDQIEVKSG